MRALGLVVAAPLIGLGLVTAQAAPTAATPYHATLSASEEVPTPGPAGGTGTAKVTIDMATNQLCYDLSWSSQVGSPSASHIHRGPKGLSGPIVVPLNEPPSPKACVTVAAPVLQGIASNPGGYYVNIHTNAYPNGAVRGQLQAG
jgi:hypothetical protein